MKILNTYQNVDIIYPRDMDSVMTSVLANIPLSATYREILSHIHYNSNVYYSVVELKESNYSKNRHSASLYPYIKSDLIAASTNNNTTRSASIYLSIHPSIAIDAMYLKQLKYTNKQILDTLSIFYKNDIQAAGYRGEYIVQSVPNIYDTGYSIYTTTLSQVIDRDDELVSLESNYYHYLNTLKIPTTRTYRHYSDYGVDAIPYFTIDNDRINKSKYFTN